MRYLTTFRTFSADMELAVFTKFYDSPPVCRGEVLRYAGVRECASELDGLVDECISLAEGQTAFRVCYCELPVSVCGDEVAMGCMKVASKSLSKNLAGCDSAVIFAATVGIELDRLVARYSSVSPAKALILQAIGAERIECLCDTFNAEIAREQKTRPRFSPGYGDFPLEAQREIFALLDCPRRIGLTLNDSLLMSPTKSVTAVIGISAK